MMFVIPAWSSTIAPRQVRQLVDALMRWRADMSRASARPADHSDEGADEMADEGLEDDLLAARRCLLDLRPTVTGVLLEPGNRGYPVPLALLFAAASREIAARMAITYGVLRHGRTDPGTAAEWQRMEAVARVADVSADVDRAVTAYWTASGAEQRTSR